jgi:hypothetical protein
MVRAPAHLGDSPLWVLNEAEDGHREHHVERGVRERQAAARWHPQIRSVASVHEALSRACNRDGGDVHAYGPRACVCSGEDVRPVATPDVEDIAAFELGREL